MTICDSYQLVSVYIRQVKARPPTLFLPPGDWNSDLAPQSMIMFDIELFYSFSCEKGGLTSS